MRSFVSMLTGAALAAAGIVGLAAVAQAEEGVMRLITFEGYADDDWIEQFEEQYDAEVRVTFIGAVDELFAKPARPSPPPGCRGPRARITTSS